ncbi:MAG: Gfo/Idh/MocA family oxidoreductase [Chloroflexi bacterium]|nr:Gfo/Idh/MocA family oxidoreductase [Chloroflexota bacterium]
MTGDRIGVGIVGANVRYGWGTRAHLPALQALPEFELVGVATTRMETARETAEQHGIANAFDSVEALAAHPDVELVLVCVRVPNHHALTMAALEAGKHVFTEWPLGANLAEAQQLRDRAHSAGVQHMVGLQARVAPPVVRMRQLIAEGYVGEVLSATLQQTLPGATARRQSFAWATDVSKGASTLSIAGGHALDMLMYCLGELHSVSGTVTTRVRSVPIEDTGETVTVTSPDTVLIAGEVEGGAAISAAITSVPAHGSGLRLEVHGSEGVLRITSGGMSQIAALTLSGARNDAGEVAELPIPADCWWVPQDLVGPGLNVAQLFRRLGEAIRGGAPAVPDFDHAVRRHEVLDAIQRASDTGERQQLS